MSSPLIDMLHTQHGFTLLDADNIDAFLAENPHSVLFFTEDADRYPESNDVAVILPELMKLFGDRCRVGVVGRKDEKSLQRRYGFSAWPALVFLRGHEYLGVITQVQDWADYLIEFDRLLKSETSQPPTIGIPVVGGTPASATQH